MSIPDWCNPQAVPSKETCQQVRVSSLCERGWQPLLILGYLRDHLARHFHDASQVEADDLRQHLWRDHERTGILIESVYKWVDGLTERRPALLIAQNAHRSIRLVLGDLAGRTGNGDEEYTELWVGSHTVFCLHEKGAAASMLANEVRQELGQFAPKIRRYLGLHRFAVTEVGAVSEVEEAKHHFAVPITIGWAFQQNWVIRCEALPMRRFSVEFILD